MSQSKRKKTAQKSVEKAPSSIATDREQKGQRTAITITWRTGLIIASAVITVILIIIGVRLYISSAPLRCTLLTVDDVPTIRMDYFLKRMRVVDVEPMTMLQVLTNEQFIKLGAPRYGIEVSPEDIEQALRTIAQGESETITDIEFKEWYRQQLNETRLSDSEYKEWVAISLLTIRLHEYLAERVPTVTEQVHLYYILVESYDEAMDVRDRWEAGEDFADLAREVSLDIESKEKGGDLGWFPPGIMDSDFDHIAFHYLSPGVVSEPLRTEEGYFYLLLVSEKADAREVDEVGLLALKDKSLENWLIEEKLSEVHKVGWHGFSNGFDSETNAWIIWQLSKE